MDISDTIAPKSDQQNFDDYLAGPRTVTVSGVKKGSVEQPVNIELEEYPGKPYKPNKSMRRVLFMLWGSESDIYVGRRLTLFGNPSVLYGGKAVGGIEIAAMSNLDKPMTVTLTENRGKKRRFTVQPLAVTPATAQPDLTIPDSVKTNTAKAIAEGTVAGYLAWLTENNAPQHFIDHVNAAAKEATT